MFSPSRGVPKGAPNRLNIVIKIRVDIKTYRNLLQEGSERAPKPKKSSRRGSSGELRAPDNLDNSAVRE